MRLSVRGWWQGLVAGQSTAGVRSAIALSPPATATGPYGQRDCSPLALPQPSITSVHVPSTPALAPRWLRSIRIYCEWRGKRRRALGLSSHGKQTQNRKTQAVTVRWHALPESSLIYFICHFWIFQVLWQAFLGVFNSNWIRFLRLSVWIYRFFRICDAFQTLSPSKMINLSPFFVDIYHFSKPLMSLFRDFARQGWWCLGNSDVPKLFLACFPLSTLIFVKKQIEKTTYGINIRIFHSRLLVWRPSVGSVASLAKSLFFFRRPPPSSESDQAKTIARTQRSTPWPPQPLAGPAAPLSPIWESCQFRSLVRSEAEASPLTGEESLARLSLSLGVKAVTDPNAYTVVAAFRFILAAWLVSFNEGSRHRIISIPIMRVSQAANYFLFRTLFPELFFSHHLT